jgi:tRNA pseudouridine55 synthase
VPADAPAPDGLVVVDKPADWTSHDVVARVRRLARTRRVGHAGTLDPMATGVLLVGIGKATRLLGHLALTEKTYTATIRLGQTTNTDDAQGETTATTSAAAVTDDAVRAGVAVLTGPIEQVPPQVSAIKVNGERAYKLARAGEDVALAARPVTVHAFTITAIRRPADADVVDVDAEVVCSSGTYIRGLARDLGAGLAVGGHLTALRRTRVGPYDLSAARTLDELAAELDVLPLADAVAAGFPRRDVTAEQARAVAHGGRLAPAGLGPGPVGVFDPDGALLALVEERDGAARPLAVFVS